MDRIRILIADDHAPVRASTRRIIEREKDLEVVAEAGDGQEAVTLATALKPDVAIVDIVMPELDGIEVTRRIKERSPSTAVLMLTVVDDTEFMTKSIEVGAAGYLLKSIHGRELIQAVREAYAGYQAPSGSILWRVLERSGKYR